MYNSVLLEQWLMLVRKNEVIDADYEDPAEKIKKSKIVICTTMYREVLLNTIDLALIPPTLLSAKLYLNT